MEGVDKLLDHSLTSEHVIESLKSIMSSVSQNYHATIIFSTTDPSKLDRIALEAHRTVKIDANAYEQ